jgi:putative thioredoxin
MNQSPHSADVTSADFETRVLTASRDVPVLVDFWAGWCAPCRSLKPVLEKLATEYQGRFFLAKVDTDAEQGLAARYDVRSLPTVKLFRNGQPVDEFMGALPESQVRAFLERHLPRPSDTQLTQALVLSATDPAGGIGKLREIVEGDPGSDRAKLELARLLLAVDSTPAADQEAARLLAALSHDKRDGPEAGALKARLELRLLAAMAPALPDLERRLQQGDQDLDTRLWLGTRRILAGQHESGMELLLEIIRRDRRFRDDAARKALLASFELLGAQDERVKKFRLLLSRALY